MTPASRSSEGADDLHASRARVFHAVNAERRRIERSLHDGIQQHLVAMAVKVRLAHDLIADDADGARGLLAELQEDLRASLQSLRDLAHRIYPALLHDGGLHDALAVAANKIALPVDVSASGVGRYPPDIEAAVYFTCAEALSHAEAAPEGTTHVSVRVTPSETELGFEVSVDGASFADPYPASDPFALLADRVRSVGGRVVAGSAEGGSRIAGAVPVP